MPTCDYLIIGGGVIGLSVARELKAREPGAKVVLIEKEASLGAHASGRNSGVVHSGIYYTADSLKARLTRDGGRELMAFCEAKGIPVRRCGKLIVARNERVSMLDELMRRGEANGVGYRGHGGGSPRDRASGEDNRPRAHVRRRLLDPRLVITALEKGAEGAGVVIVTETRYLEPASHPLPPGGGMRPNRR
jgi:glycine/D-amino acid oxidase-like deaminating enzyme